MARNRKPRRKYNPDRWAAQQAEKKIRSLLFKARLKFVGEVTVDMQRVCETNCTNDILALLTEYPHDWHFDVQAVCDGYIAHEIRIFREAMLGDLNQEIIDLQKRVRDSVNDKHLLKTQWFARLALPGETV